MGRREREKVLAFVETVVSEGTALLTKRGMAEAEAQAVAVELAKRICWRHAKSWMYVPAALDFGRDDRDAEIYAAYGTDGPDGARRFTKDRAEQLAAEHGFTVQHVYRIVRLQKHLEMVARQTPLDGFEHPKNPR